MMMMVFYNCTTIAGQEILEFNQTAGDYLSFCCQAIPSICHFIKQFVSF
jgi:hypothetical protein